MAPRFEIDGSNSEEPTNHADAADTIRAEPEFSANDSHEDLPVRPGTNPTRDNQAGTPELVLSGNDGSWRDEVADRVSRYRARRRPITPRYPSLRLRFDVPDTKPRIEAEATPIDRALAIDSNSVVEDTEPLPEPGKLIEFPRPLMPPLRPLDELAEPMLDRPRILEVPEVAPPPPVLGGILIEPTEPAPEEKRPGFEIPLQAASMSRRVVAAGIDGLFVLMACALFGYVFFRITKTIPPLPLSAEMLAVLAVTLWSSYQFLLVFFAGSTPGLRLAKLQLSRFEGDPVPRRLRRWRLLASMLSGVSLGLGYAWCFLDEDQLCWHDRITRTYIAPKK